MTVRVLHVVGALDRGGAETWLMHLLRRVDRRQVALDVLVHRDRPGAYDDEARALGATIIPCARTARPLRYGRELAAILRRQGPYHAIHSHVHHFSGWILGTAARAGVAVRIAHSHTTGGDARRGWLRALYTRWCAALIRRHATHGLATSAQAAAALFGSAWRRDPRWEVLLCGLDLGAFARSVDRAAVRAGLGIADDALVIGHVGRFDPAKNHELLLEIAAAARRTDPRVVLLAVGDGPLHAEVRRRAAELGVEGRFPGSRGDVPALLAAMDVFVFPSRYEGLGLAMVEAQAAGLPVVHSDAVAAEAVLAPDLTTALSIADPPERWARAALAARPGAPGRGLAAVMASPFNLDHGLDRLLAIYRSAT